MRRRLINLVRVGALAAAVVALVGCGTNNNPDAPERDRSGGPGGGGTPPPGGGR